jgi:shikimate dehydrogenase
MSGLFRFGLIGWPVKHSLSPVIHQAALEALVLEGDYRCFPVEPLPEGLATLEEVLEQMRRGALQGLNVTVPHKEAVIERMEGLTSTAERIGAVNTIFLDGKKLIGDNTDQDGFLSDLQTTLAPETGKALILGAGGAARAVVSGLTEGGWDVWVATRRLSQAEELAQELRTPGASPINILSLNPESIGRIHLEMTLIVNATPAGMAPEVDVSPWPNEIPLPPQVCLYDLVYTPQKTQLVRDAQSAGLRAVTGLGMLVEQAALAFERWTDRSAPRDVMYEAAERVSRLAKGEGS